ncbi:MAG: hypothetical protein EA426_09605 [Spirochaetaceae bacterium]|nr:MAG: hypothetical protein EA426_09605 [Spirochaetaceae bacterium]
MKYNPIVFAFLAAAVFSPPRLVSEPLSAAELSRLILEGEVDLSSPELVDTDGEFARYDDLGFPETASGRLVVSRESYGPAVRLRGERTPYLLYAQYINEQRDAVMLARDGDFTDPLPDGTAYTVPFGFGAVKMNAVDVSLVESIAVPHFSDNRKTYLTFPLFDLYGGVVTGSDGFGPSLRAVFRERYTVNASVTVASAWAYDGDRLTRSPIAAFSAGAGFRFPGVLPDLIGPNLITVGADVSVRVRGGALGGGAEFLPGAFVEIERVFFDTVPEDRDFRLDPRPYNYRVHSVYARLTGHLDVAGIGSGDPFRTGVSIGYRVNVIGPRIPEHEFKSTEIVYVADEYRQDLQTQAERRSRRE